MTAPRLRTALLCLSLAIPLVSRHAAAQAPAPAPSGPAVPVTVAATARSDVPIILRNIGAVQAFQSVLVRARVDGTLDQVFFQEGQDVKRGDKLAQIDPRPYARRRWPRPQAKKAPDEAQLANAQRDLARFSSLVRSDFASRQQVDTQAAQVAQFQATVAGRRRRDRDRTAQPRLHQHHLADRRPGRLAAGRSRQPDPRHRRHRRS